LIFFSAAILGTFATWIWMRVAERLRLLDPPNPLIPQHRRPTAHMGGVAVAAATYAAIALHLLGGDPALRVAHAAGTSVVLLGGVSFLLLGILDDIFRLSARSKFAGQLLVASFSVASGLIYPFSGIPWIDGPVSGLLVLAAVNAVNLTDVCDGLVAGLAAISLAVGAAMQPELGPWSLAAAGACAGFLVFNAPPARVFLGDAGSHWLGFMLIAAMLSMPPVDPPGVHAARTLLLCGVFFFEIALLVVARESRGIPFWQGSPDHLALRLQAAGLSRWRTVALAWTVGAGLAALAFALPALAPAARGSILLGVLGAAVAAHLALLFGMKPPRTDRTPSAEPKRLLWIHQNFVSARQAGNSRAMHLVAALLERGWAVDVVTTQAGYLDDVTSLDQDSFREEREGRLTIHRFRSRDGYERRGRSWLVFGVKSLLYIGHFRRIDVVYASTPPLPQILLAVIASLVRRAPLVLEVRDLWPLFLERQGSLRPGILRAAMRWIEAFSYRFARRSIAVSPAFVQYLSAMGIPRASLTASPTGMVAPRLDPAEALAWRRAQGLESAFVVLYAGSFNESYDLERLLAAAERTTSDPRIQWVFAGDGRSRRAVEEALRRLPNVRYVGRLEKDRLWPVLQGADLGIVSLQANPILQMVIPGKLFDYCAARLPVLCTVEGIAGAIVREAAAGRVVPDATAEDLADAVREIAAWDEATRRECGDRAHRWMSANMSSARSARAMVRVVEEVVRDEGSRSQWTALARAAAGATLDTMVGRADRAAKAVLTPDLSRRCEESLKAWLDGGLPRDREAEAPLAIPVLLTARSGG
jgi:UDP-GlcNAc:undecaprenyl-phosphate/decaprenyl-phosphate GlcNAc-1-phosphate transferase